MNFSGSSTEPDPSGGVWDVNVRCVDATLETPTGERADNVEQGEPIGLRLRLEARADLERPVFGIHFVDALGTTVFGFNRTLMLAAGEEDRVPAGHRFAIAGTVENRLVPGRYFVHGLRRAQPHAGRLRAAHGADVRVRRLRHRPRSGPRVRASRRRGARRARGEAAGAMSDAPLELREVRGPSAFGGGRGARSTCCT